MSTMTPRRWTSPLRRRTRILALTAVAALVASATAQAAMTDPFTAHFEVKRGNLGLGTTTFTLAPGERGGCYVYRGRAMPNALVSLFMGAITDESRFCMEDGAVRPQHFSHHVDGDRKKSYTLDFDWGAHEVRYRSEAGKQGTMTLPEHALDPLSIHIAARQWVDAADDPDALGAADFPMVDEDEIKTYRLQAGNGGTVSTPGGRFDTVLVQRIGHAKQLRFWLARSANWIPVRVEQQKGSDGTFRMNLTSLDRDAQG